MESRPATARHTALGVVSFLNARPLIEGIEDDRAADVRFAVPSRLAEMLDRRDVDAALVPVVDFARAGGAWQILSDACIASDGETLTVRVFSRVPPPDVRVIHADGDSHTSVVLAQLIWQERFGRPVAMRPLAALSGPAPGGSEAVLLIGDKVVTSRPEGLAHDLDLGRAWKDWTGLPFVFAVWAARSGRDLAGLAERLSAARDRGVADARRLAARHGPPRGWPVAVAEAYLTQHMKYTLTPEARQGMERFLTLARAAGLLAAPRNAVAT